MIYLDNAATSGKKPMGVIKAVNSALLELSANPGRGGHKASLRASEAIFKVRQKVSSLFGASGEDRVIFTPSCTAAINFALKGLLSRGDGLVISSLEHNSVTRPSETLKKQGVEVTVAEVIFGDKEATLRSFERAIKSNTKAVVCMHASNVTGEIMPIAAIGELCKKRNIIFIVDAAQTAGVLPINMKNMNIDFPIEASDGGRGLTYAIIRKYFLVDDVIGKGYRTGWCPVTGDYYTMTNTNQKAVTTSNEHTGRYGIFENNIINMQSQIYKEDGTQHYAQGIFLRSDAYLHNNKILNTGTLGTANNDGEIFCTENPNGGTVRYAGDVVSATLNTVSLKYQKDASGEPFAYKFNGCSNSELDPRFGFYYAMIVEGRGIGQIRHVTGNVRDSEIATLTLKDPWDIVPDKTSKILMTTLTKETVYYDNYAENCEKGFWFYGGTYDSIAEKCNGVNVEGILSRNFDVESTNRRTYGYFNVFKDNSLVGTSRLGGVSYISIDVSNEVKQASFGISLYGSEIKRNYMEGALYEAKPEKNTEGLYQNGIFLGYTSPWIAPTQNFVHASIIEDNSLVNMNNGICVGSLKNSKQTGMGVSGVIIKGNNFTNVKNHISTYGIVENLIQIGQ